MNPKSKGIVRFLTATDDVVKAYTLSSGASANLHVIKAVDTYTRCNNDVNKEVARMGSGADSGQVAGCAKAWLDAYQAIPVVPRIELLFKAAHDGAAAAASTGSSRAARWVQLLEAPWTSGTGPPTADMSWQIHWYHTNSGLL